MIQNLPHQPTDVNLSLLTDSTGLGSGFYIFEKYDLDFIFTIILILIQKSLQRRPPVCKFDSSSSVLCLFLLFLECFQGTRLMIAHLGDVCQLINKGRQILFIPSRQNDIIIMFSKPSSSGLSREHFFPFLSETVFW